jgi:hypothetical protein
MISTVSMTLLNAETVSAVSMTPLKFEYNRFLGEYEAICKTALGRESGP